MNNADNGVGSLRQAITNVNNDTGTKVDTITFAIPPGSDTITLQTPLPEIKHPIAIDGTSQKGYLGTPIIVIDGTNLSGQFGLQLAASASGSTIEALEIENFGGTSLNAAGIDVLSSNDVIQSNVITGNAAGIIVDTGTGNALSQNLIYATGPGIQLLNGGNEGEANPTISSVTSVPGLTIIKATMTGTVSGNYTVDFYASDPTGTLVPANEFIGSTIVAYTAPGSQSFTGSFNNVPTLTNGQSVTATVTSPANATPPQANNTSTFAQAFLLRRRKTFRSPTR